MPKETKLFIRVSKTQDETSTEVTKEESKRSMTRENFLKSIGLNPDDYEPAELVEL